MKRIFSIGCMLCLLLCATQAKSQSGGRIGLDATPNPLTTGEQAAIRSNLGVGTYFGTDGLIHPMTGSSFNMSGDVIAPVFCLGTSCVSTWPVGGAMLFPAGTGIMTVSGGSGYGSTIPFDSSGNLVLPAGLTVPGLLSASNLLANPLTTTGDLLYWFSGPQRLGVGTTGQVLAVGPGGVPGWATPSTPSNGGISWQMETSDFTPVFQ